MGCKESKHIATDNTILTPYSSTRSTIHGQDDNDKNNVQTLQKSRSGKSPMQEQESLKDNNVGDSKANNVLIENENEKSGADNKGTENAEGGKLIEIDDQVVEGNNNEIIEENGNVGDEVIIKEKEDQNGNVVDNEGKESIKENGNGGNEVLVNEKEDQNGNVVENGGKESILVSKEDLPSTTTKDGESIEAIDTDGVSGASVYSTPKEVAGPFDSTKTENPEEKKEPVEETEDTKTEETAKENPENHVLEAEAEEKITDAEAAVESLEKLVKEADKAEEATILNPVNETEEVSVKEVEATNSSAQNPEEKTDISEEIQETPTDANPQNQQQQTDIPEGDPGTETRDTDATLQNAMTESEITQIKEALENVIKEIHEVAGKAEEIPVEEATTAHKTDQEDQELVADKDEEVLEKIEEAGYVTPVDPVKEAEAANTVKENLMTAAEAANKTEEKPVNELQSVAEVQTQDAAEIEEDTKSSNTGDGRQISKEDPDVQISTDDSVKQ